MLDMHTFLHLRISICKGNVARIESLRQIGWRMQKDVIYSNPLNQEIAGNRHDSLQQGSFPIINVVKFQFSKGGLNSRDWLNKIGLSQKQVIIIVSRFFVHLSMPLALSGYRPLLIKTLLPLTLARLASS